jgi:CheY-like chemotaxis protein
VLLVDDDSWTQQEVSAVLRKRGHSLRLADSNAQGLADAADFSPDLIITDAVRLASDPSGEAGSALVEGLRRRGRLQATALLVLSGLPPYDERVQALGADGYLAKPFRYLDLDRAVERAVLVQRRRVAADVDALISSEVPVSSGIHGSLAQLGLGSLLTMIELERKSGILLMRRGSLSARLYCREGRVLAARLFGATPMSGVDVVYQLLAWTDGNFNFTSMPVSVTDEIGRRTTHLLLEGARRSDEGHG